MVSFNDWSVAQQANTDSMVFLVIGVALFFFALVLVFWFVGKRRKKVEEGVLNETSDDKAE